MAEIDGRLKSGDRIAYLGSHLTKGKSHQEVLALLREVSTGEFINIGVERETTGRGERAVNFQIRQVF